MSKTYRVGIAGVTHGHVSAHLREWKEIPNAKVVAIADANAAERERYVTRYEMGDVRQFDSIAGMLEKEELDIVSVCNETSNHASVVELAAAHRVHAIVEKPLAFSLADAERMLAAAGKHRVYVLTNYPSRWGNRATTRALEFVKRGGIGRPYEVRHRGGGTKPRAIDANTFFQWLYQPVTNGAGAFMDYCCYGVDMAVGILGSPNAVYAVAGRWQRNDLITDDNARMLLQYHRGGALVEATWSQFGHLPFSTLFLGEEGTLAIGHHGAVLYNAENEHSGGREIPLEELPAPVAEASLPAHLMASLERSEWPVDWAGIAFHRDVTEVLDAGLRSVKTGQVVHLPLPLPLMQAADY
ncbi:MAG: Gfo/Idh/MocA family oxidoreductase [Chloroflexi bacterium]|nr:Gfo/Idh/MocA family oxidoreductase [Chloroflexota bacterium]